MITRSTVAEKIHHYLNHHITLAQLVSWSEEVVAEAEIADGDIDVVMEVTTKIGLADVENFGLLWEDCEDMLRKLGYELNFDLKRVA